MIVLRTFSKALQAAGIRLGYLLARPSLVTELNKVKLLFSVGMFQQAAGVVILDNRELLEKNIADVVVERERVFDAFHRSHSIEGEFYSFQIKKPPGHDSKQCPSYRWCSCADFRLPRIKRDAASLYRHKGEKYSVPGNERPLISQETLTRLSAVHKQGIVTPEGPRRVCPTPRGGAAGGIV
ncbi:MAG: aminotransferase class I/II-fold pyridoxal phosphate-dependent enzyme [bacterium]|nr:aminotransferase class I/II-fold pyridoxal phosphate-dependent enzyme [bacterium]